ncbi:MAG: LysR family transcriptional regulator [Evtepia sp.]
MELQKYRLFVDLAETGNITRTGERMGYTQSGVSRFLKNMEKELGFALFVRTHRGLALTAAGKEVLPAAQELLRSGERLEETIHALNGLRMGSVTIAVSAGISVRLLPAILRDSLMVAPKIVLKIQEGNHREIENWLMEGTVDFALCRHCEKAEWIPLWKENYFAVLPYNSPAKRHRSISIKLLAEEPIVSTQDISNQWPEFWKQENITLRSIMSDAHAVLAMVKNGLGCAILPELIVSGHEAEVTILPLNPPCVEEIGICVRSQSEMNPAARNFFECVRTYAAEHPNLQEI